MRALVALVLAALVGAAAWFVARDAPDAAGSPGPVARSVDEVVGSDAALVAARAEEGDGGSESEREDERAVSVVSSLGIELAGVEQRIAGAWIGADVSDGAPRVRAEATHVRAFGHLEHALEPDAIELVLEPGAALTVEVPGLGDMLEDVRVDVAEGVWYDEPGELVAWGFDGLGTWHAAVSVERVQPSPPFVGVVLQLRGGMTLGARLSTATGVHGQIVLALPDFAPVELELAPHEGGPSEVEVDVRILGLPDLGGWHAEAWGGWYVGLVRRRELSLRVDSDGASLRGVPLGARLGIAHEKSGGAAELEHDGRTISLHVARLELIGQLVLPIEGPAPRLSVDVQDLVGGTSASLLFDPHGRPIFADDGAAQEPPHAVRLALHTFAATQGDEPPPSRRVEVRVRFECSRTLDERLEVEPYDDILRETHEVGDTSLWNLGAIRIAWPAPDLVLAAGHGLPEPIMDLWVRPEGTTSRTWAVEWSRPRPSGELELLVCPHDLDSPELIFTDGDVIYELVQRADGRYERLAYGAYRIFLAIDALPPDAQGLHVGWFADGEERLLGFVAAEDVPAARELAFEAPPDGVELWWARGSRRVADPAALRPGEGSVALAALEGTVRIP